MGSCKLRMVACLNVLSKYYLCCRFVLHFAMHWWLQEDWYENSYIWCSPTRSRFSFLLRKVLNNHDHKIWHVCFKFQYSSPDRPTQDNQSINQKRKHWVGSLQKWHRVIHTPSFSHTLIVLLTSTYLNAGQVSSKFFSFLLCHHIVICETIYKNKRFLFIDSYQRLCHSGCGCSYLHQNFWCYHGNSKCVRRIPVYPSVSRHHTQKRPGN